MPPMPGGAYPQVPGNAPGGYPQMQNVPLTSAPGGAPAGGAPGGYPGGAQAVYPASHPVGMPQEPGWKK